MDRSGDGDTDVDDKELPLMQVFGQKTAIRGQKYIVMAKPWPKLALLAKRTKRDK